MSRDNQDTQSFVVDNAGWYYKGNAVILPVFRDDGVFVGMRSIGKSCIVSAKPFGKVCTKFELVGWVCRKNLLAGYRFGND